METARRQTDIPVPHDTNPAPLASPGLAAISPERGDWDSGATGPQVSAAHPLRNDRFHLAFQNSVIGMVIASADDVYLDVNDAFCAMVGRSREELIGQTPSLVTHADDREGSAYRRGLLVSGELDAYVVEKRFIRPDRQELIGLVSV